MANSHRVLKRSRRSPWFVVALAVGVAIALGAATAGVGLFLLKPVSIRVAVGPANSDDARLIQSLAAAFARDRGRVRLVPIITDTGADSMSLLKESKTDMAIARADVEMPADAQSVAVLRKNVVVLWTTASTMKTSGKTAKSKINGLDEAPGRKLAIIGTSKTNAALLKVILETSGVAYDKVTVVQFAVDKLADMVRDVTIDIFMAVGPLNSKITADAIALTAKLRGEPKFLPVDVGDAIAKKFPLYESEEIPGSSFSTSPARPADKIDTVGIDHLIVARKALSDTTVNTFAHQLFAARQTMAKELPALAQVEAPDTDKAAAIPAHQGSASYIDGTERTFLEKYSDFLWGGVLLISGLGSLGAWSRQYSRRDEFARVVELRSRLLKMISESRESTDPIRLDQIRVDADQVLHDLLDSFDDGAVEDSTFSAFTLLFEQLDAALARQANVIVDKRGAPRVVALAP